MVYLDGSERNGQSRAIRERLVNQLFIQLRGDLVKRNVRRFLRPTDMVRNLKPSEPLSQVVFIHDYLQLVFQDEGFNIYNLAEVDHRGVRVAQGQPGFCDAVVSLIGQRVIAVSKSDTHLLKLSFEDGVEFSVRSDNDAVSGPEAFQFNGKNQPTIVEQNA